MVQATVMQSRLSSQLNSTILWVPRKLQLQYQNHLCQPKLLKALLFLMNE